jgi:hypothetical protein
MTLASGDGGFKEMEEVKFEVELLKIGIILLLLTNLKWKADRKERGKWGWLRSLG